MADSSPKVALVTGGAGFLGRALCALLRRQGVTVRSLDLSRHPDPAVESVVGDLADPAVCERACAGVDTVFHTAALIDWSHNKAAALHRVNVEGTQHLLGAARTAGVQRLVFTSTVDVLFGGRPLAGADETTPPPARHLDDYGRTKALAERVVLRADGVQGLRTCALRVATLWGPGERFRIPRFADMARRGTMIALGNGKARFSHLYIDNAAHAHWLACLALGDHAGGEAFFVVDPPETNFFEFYTPILEAAGFPVRWRWIPTAPLHPLARLSEVANRLGLTGADPPLLTRFTVTSTSVDFWFRGDKARRVLGYAPVVPHAEAVARTARWLRAERPA